MLRYAITDGSPAQLVPAERVVHLRNSVQRWAAGGVHFIQIREKTVPAGELFALVSALVAELTSLGSGTQLLVNARADLALAGGAHGVHLTSATGELTPEQVRTLFARAGRNPPVVSISCHTLAEVFRARENGVDLILFGPVFEKVVQSGSPRSGTGLQLLSEAARIAGPVPLLALGGVTLHNLQSCMHVGASGVAGIRSFNEV